MRRSVIFAAALALILGASAFGESALSASTTPPVKKITIASFSQCGNGYFCFKPATVTVKKGTKVVWTNTTPVDHTVTRCTKAACGVTGGTGKQLKFGSPTLAPHKTYTFLFTGVGTYRYFCNIHGYGLMHGMITVTS